MYFFHISEVGYNVRLMLFKAALDSHILTPSNSKKKMADGRMCEVCSHMGPFNFNIWP
jgi:hypothetical protein